jgi:hypothetical protein
MHGLVALFLEVIALAIILLLMQLFVLVVLVFATRVIMASIVLMTIVRLLVVVIVSVALMVVVILAMMLRVAQITAMRDGKMNHFLCFWLLLLDLLKDAGHFISSLTLLKKGNEPKRIHGHHFICLHKLELMCLGRLKEDLFGLLLRCGQLNCSTDIVTVRVAEEVYSVPHELIH